MIAESPYLFDRTGGLVHIRLRADPARCIADVRIDAFDILWSEAKREAFAEAQAAAEKAAGGNR